MTVTVDVQEGTYCVLRMAGIEPMQQRRRRLLRLGETTVRGDSETANLNLRAARRTADRRPDGARPSGPDSETTPGGLEC